MKSKRKKIFLKIAVLFFAVLCAMWFIFSPRAQVNVQASSSENVTYFGTVVPCGKDNGYKPNTTSKWNPWTLLTVPGMVMGLIPDDDPHQGWSLGSFFVKGYSARTSSSVNAYCEEVPVYLKNAGDTLTFGFKLEQNIDKLNGNSKLVIADDKEMVQDCWIEEPYFNADFHRGLLIVEHTDYQGNKTTVRYTDFLNGLSVGANTQVDLFEEGDYRVILAYEIYKDTAWNWITDWMDPNGSWFDYRMESYFSVRNGNCMVYPFDTQTNNELSNRSYTTNGFRIDLANSQYLQTTVKKENLNAEGTDVVEDIRFNKVVSDGAWFSAEGKYTITVRNVYTNATTEKIIYVGANDVMRCNVVTGKSIPEINACLSAGYGIAPNGMLTYGMSATKEQTVTEKTVGEEPSRDSVVVEAETPVKDTENNVWKILGISSTSVLAIGAIFLCLKKFL